VEIKMVVKFKPTDGFRALCRAMAAEILQKKGITTTRKEVRTLAVKIEHTTRTVVESYYFTR
jgi:hypothetical protein